MLEATWCRAEDGSRLAGAEEQEKRDHACSTCEQIGHVVMPATPPAAGLTFPPPRSSPWQKDRCRQRFGPLGVAPGGLSIGI